MSRAGRDTDLTAVRRVNAAAVKNANINFVRAQGWRDVTPQACDLTYNTLMWQPRAILVLALIGLLVEAPAYWLGLGVLLLWNALVPRLNPFDAIYNAVVLKPRRLPPVGPARAPRRFSQGLAATFMLGIGLAMRAGNVPLAWAFIGFLFLALFLLVFVRFCLGSYLYHLVTGQLRFANRTLPWSRESDSKAR
jgi:hypothetical protein